jgi:hypothetical protein
MLVDAELRRAPENACAEEDLFQARRFLAAAPAERRALR